VIEGRVLKNSGFSNKKCIEDFPRGKILNAAFFQIHPPNKHTVGHHNQNVPEAHKIHGRRDEDIFTGSFELPRKHIKIISANIPLHYSTLRVFCFSIRFYCTSF